MDCSSSEPLEYQQSEEYRLHELSSIVEDKLKPKNCENTLKLNNSIQNVNAGSSHTLINPAIQLTKRNVLRDNTNTHHLRQKKQSKDEEKENRITEECLNDKNYLRAASMSIMMEQSRTTMQARSNSPATDEADSSVSNSGNTKAVPMQSETLTSLLKPALVNSTKARVNGQIGRSNSYKTPSPKNRKPMKQIRFDLGNTSKDDSWLSPTPPPKDFKRMGKQRMTMLPPRNERCMSTAITQKELQEAFLFGDDSNHTTKVTSNSDEKGPTQSSTDKKNLYSLDNYTFRSPASKVAPGHVRSLCNLYDKEIKERENSPVKNSVRNVGKLPGFEDYPAKIVNRSLEEGNRSFASLNRSRSFNCSSLSTSQNSSSSPSSRSSSLSHHDVKSNESSPNWNSSNPSSPELCQTEEQCKDTEKTKYTSFKGLFRSRSWSLKRKKGRIEVNTSHPITNYESSVNTATKTDTPKRCSPSYSVKSQDSGFSDSGESNHGAVSKLNGGQKSEDDKERRKKISMAQQKRLEFLTTTNDEDEEDPNLTQLPTHVDNPIYSYVLNPNDTKEAKDKVASSVGNIASISEGLRVKRALMEENSTESLPPLHQKCVNFTDNITQESKIKDKDVYKVNISENFSDFVRPKSVIVQTKNTSPLVSPKAYDIGNTSQTEDIGTLVFSTPLRESFRKRQARPKTMAVFHLDEAKTPSKRASKNPKLKEMKKTSEMRRWSNIEVADLRNQQANDVKGVNNLSKLQSTEEVDVDEQLRECNDDETLRINNMSQYPAGIDPSMIAVWSQLADFEADLPENISTYSCLSNAQKTPKHAKYNGSFVMKYVKSDPLHVTQHATAPKQDLSSTQLSNINYPSHDVTISRNKAVEDTDLQNATSLSRMESCCVDGTSTQLLVESYCNKYQPSQSKGSPGYEIEELLDASYSINNSSRSANLLSIPPINGNEENGDVTNEKELLLCPRTPNHRNGNSAQNTRDLNESPRNTSDNHDEPKSPVCEWWRDLHAWCEPECMTYLQSKPIMNNSLNKDGASSTSGLSTNTSGSSILSNNSMSSANKSSLSSNGSYLNYDASNLASLKSIKKLQSGANEIFATFESMSNSFNDAGILGTTNQFGYNLGKSVHILLSQIQEYVFEFNLSHQSQKTETDDMIKNETATLDVLDTILDSISGCSEIGIKSQDIMRSLPGFKVKEGKSSLLLQQIERNNANSAMASPGSKSIEDEDKGIAEILMLQQRTVLQMVDRLKLCTHRCQYTPQQPIVEMRRILSLLDKAFKKLVNQMLTKEIKHLVRDIDRRPLNSVELRNSLNTVIQLGNEASPSIGGISSICSLFSREGGIRVLLSYCNGSRGGYIPGRHTSPIQLVPADVRILALRGLGAICCVAECIRQFESCDGLYVINDLLSGKLPSTVEDRVESAAVLAQITSPWISDNHKIHNLDLHVMSMVTALTGLSRLNGSEETFLLVTAALANLTFMSPLTSTAMKRVKTADSIVRVVKMSPFTSLFAKDQVVTILANMAANGNCRHEIQSLDGVGFLLSMLDTEIPKPIMTIEQQQENTAEVLAAERVQKKSAIALSRLCNDPTVCRDLIRLGGADRLVELCKNQEKRNHSDAILVACLAVLRRLKTNLLTSGATSDDLDHVLQSLNAIDLVQPKLVDSFLEYSTNKQESYV